MKVVVVLPAYNCAKSLKKTISEIPNEIVDEIVLVDDFSSDDTLKIAKECRVEHIVKHNKNLGYGANQKTCYDKALELNADIVIMLHPDYQYDPRLITSLIRKIEQGADIVLASRMMKGFEAVRNGRAYRKNVLVSIKYHDFSNDFIFDNQIIIAAFSKGYEIQEIYCPARYDNLSSSIKLLRSTKYGFQIVYYTIKQLLKGK